MVAKLLPAAMQWLKSKQGKEFKNKISGTSNARQVGRKFF